MAIKTPQEHRNEFLKDTNAEKQAQINTVNQVYNSQVQQVQAAYNTEVTDAKEIYGDLYRENEVQRLVNQRQVNESMANLGLTDSGLNRAQQAGVQASYTQQQGRLNVSRQKTLDSLASALSAKITELQNARQLDETKIIDTFNRNADQYGQNMFAIETDAETRRQEADAWVKAADANLKAAQANEKAAEHNATVYFDKVNRESAYIIKTNDGLLSRNFTGSLAENGVSVQQDPKKPNNWLYIDANSGKRTSMPKNKNPYTGTVHKDTKNGTFSNGYQPNNIGGKKLVKVTDDYGENLQYPINGQVQSVWTYDGKVLWVWDGKDNEYHKLT